MRIAFVDGYRHRWPVRAMCRAVGLAERSYYAARSRPLSAREVRDVALKGQIRSVWDANYCCYGARRVWLALRRQGVEVARCTVTRLMAAEGPAGRSAGPEAVHDRRRRRRRPAA